MLQSISDLLISLFVCSHKAFTSLTQNSEIWSIKVNHVHTCLYMNLKSSNITKCERTRQFYNNTVKKKIVTNFLYNNFVNSIPTVVNLVVIINDFKQTYCNISNHILTMLLTVQTKNSQHT